MSTQKRFIIKNTARSNRETNKIQEGKEIKSLAIKSIINSGYGVFGHPYFKYYDPKVAEIITMLGRQTISEMQKIANSLRLTVLYGDTDSLFVNVTDSKESATKFIDECKIKLKIDKP